MSIYVFHKSKLDTLYIESIFNRIKSLQTLDFVHGKQSPSQTAPTILVYQVDLLFF